MASAAFPELSLEGSWTNDNSSIYSIADQQAVAARAKARFIELVIEIDTPAHTVRSRILMRFFCRSFGGSASQITPAPCPTTQQTLAWPSCLAVLYAYLSPTPDPSTSGGRLIAWSWVDTAGGGEITPGDDDGLLGVDGHFAL